MPKYGIAQNWKVRVDRIRIVDVSCSGFTRSFDFHRFVLFSSLCIARPKDSDSEKKKSRRSTSSICFEGTCFVIIKHRSEKTEYESYDNDRRVCGIHRFCWHIPSACVALAKQVPNKTTEPVSVGHNWPLRFLNNEPAPLQVPDQIVTMPTNCTSVTLWFHWHCLDYLYLKFVSAVCVFGMQSPTIQLE